MDARELFVVVRDIDGKPCPPLDDNDDGADDECMMVYRTLAGCQAACDYQREQYDVTCHPVQLSVFK